VTRLARPKTNIGDETFYQAHSLPWPASVRVAEVPPHLIHFNGVRFLGLKLKWLGVKDVGALLNTPIGHLTQHPD
jgi:hypothetical protein